MAICAVGKALESLEDPEAAQVLYLAPAMLGETEDLSEQTAAPPRGREEQPFEQLIDDFVENLQGSSFDKLRMSESYSPM